VIERVCTPNRRAVSACANSWTMTLAKSTRAAAAPTAYAPDHPSAPIGGVLAIVAAMSA